MDDGRDFPELSAIIFTIIFHSWLRWSEFGYGFVKRKTEDYINLFR